MAFSTRIFPSQRLGVGVFNGEIDVTDFTASLSALYASEAWVPTYYALWDCRAVSSLVLEPKDTAVILAHVDRLRDRFAKGRAAFVMPRITDYIMARLLISKTSLPKRRQKIFRRMDPALEWLERDASVIGVHHNTSEAVE